MPNQGSSYGYYFKKYLHIVHRKGADNPVADNLSRMEDIPHDPIPVNDSFPDEQLAVVKYNLIPTLGLQIMLILSLQSFCLQVLHFNRGRNSSQI